MGSVDKTVRSSRQARRSQMNKQQNSWHPQNPGDWPNEVKFHEHDTARALWDLSTTHETRTEAKTTESHQNRIRGFRHKWYPLGSEEIPNSLKVIAFLFPALIILAIFWVLPLILGIIFSLYHWQYGQNPTWVGWHEYQMVLSSPLFWQAVLNTLIFALGVVGIGTTLAILLAVLLYQNLAGRGLFRTLLFLPYVMPLVASSTIWLWIYQPGVGLLNRFLQLLGLPGTINWVQSTTWALPAVILFTVWYSLGFTTLLFLAGLTTISPQLNEAATIDGASAWTRFWSITWPLLSPTTLFVIIINTIAVFQSFTQIFELTRGGPLGATTTLTYLVYEDAFQYFHFGSSLATGVLLFIIVMLITALQLLVSKSSIHYGDEG